MILRSELKQNAKNQLKNNWGLAIGIIIVCTLISCIPNLLVEINDESLAIAIIIPIIISKERKVNTLYSIHKIYSRVYSNKNQNKTNSRYPSCGISLLLGLKS